MYVKKRVWPEVVGMTGEAARDLIRKEFIGAVYIIPHDEQPVLFNWHSPDRVYIRVKGWHLIDGKLSGGIVCMTPTIG